MYSNVVHKLEMYARNITEFIKMSSSVQLGLLAILIKRIAVLSAILNHFVIQRIAITVRYSVVNNVYKLGFTASHGNSVLFYYNKECTTELQQHLIEMSYCSLTWELLGTLKTENCPVNKTSYLAKAVLCWIVNSSQIKLRDHGSDIQCLFFFAT